LLNFFPSGITEVILEGSPFPFKIHHSRSFLLKILLKGEMTMSRHNVVLTPEEFVRRWNNADVFSFSYKNPFVLASLYYTEGLSTVEMADLLGCEQRTIRRYMNYYGLKRFTKDFALLVKHHGLEKALQMKKPTFYPLGRHDD
jgi:hypothetical protein